MLIHNVFVSGKSSHDLIELYALITDCWRINAFFQKKRPTNEQILNSLEDTALTDQTATEGIYSKKHKMCYTISLKPTQNELFAL